MKKEQPKSLTSLLEALLFAHGEPLELTRLAKLTGVRENIIQSVLGKLAHEYQNRGIAILEKNEMYQLGTNPEYASEIESLVKSDTHEELSRAAAETLAIVAYKGPLTRAEVEHIRGINSSFIMRNLLFRGLIERAENPKDLRSPHYRISFDCLKYLGIKNSEELPQYKEFRDELFSSPKES